MLLLAQSRIKPVHRPIARLQEWNHAHSFGSLIRPFAKMHFPYRLISSGANERLYFRL